MLRRSRPGSWELAATRNLLVKIGADTTDVAKKLRALTRPFNALSAAAQQTGRTLSVGLTAPLALVGGLALKMASDFESGMNRVRAVTGATGKTFEQLQAVAKDLGATTRFSATEAADAMGFLGQAGFDATKIMAALPSTLNLAAAGALELGTAADLVTDVLAGFGLEADQATRLTNILAKAAASSNTSVEQMGEAFSFVGPAAKAFGVSIEDASAAITFLSDSGVKRARAGTALRSVLSSLAKPSKAAAEALAKAGIGANDFSKGVVTLPGALQKLFVANLDASDKISIFNSKMVSAGEILISSADKFGGVSEGFRNLNDDAARMAKTMDEGAKGGIRALKSALEALAIAVTDTGILDGFNKLVRGVADMIRGLAKANPELLRFGAILAGMAAVVGPALLAIGSLGPAIVKGGTLIAGLGGPVGIAVGALGLLGTAFLLSRDDADEALQGIKDFGVGVTTIFQSGFTAAKDSLSSFSEAATELSDSFRAAIGSIVKDVQFLQDIAVRIEAFVRVVQAIPGAITGTIQNIGRNVTLLDRIAQSTCEAAAQSKALTDGWIAAALAGDRVATSGSNVGGAFGDAGDKVKTFAEKLADSIQSLKDQATNSRIAAIAQQEYAVELANAGKAIEDSEPARFKLEASLKKIAKEQEKATKAAKESVEPLRNSGAAFDNLAATTSAAVGPVLEIVGAYDKLAPVLSESVRKQLELDDAFKSLGVTTDRLAREQLEALRQKLEIINQAYLQGRASLEELQRAQENYGRAAERSGESTKKLGKDMQAVSTILDDLFRDLADFVLGMKSFADTLKSIGQSIVRTIVKATFKAMRDEILENDKALKKLIETFKKFLGLGSQKKPSTGLPGTDIETGGGKRPVDVSGGGLGGAGGVAAIISAISDVISNFQLARLEGSLNKIELNTRQTTRALTGGPELLQQSAQMIGQAADEISDATQKGFVIPSATNAFNDPTTFVPTNTTPTQVPGPGGLPSGPEAEEGAPLPGPQQGLGILQVLFEQSDFLQDICGQLNFQTASLDTLKDQAARREGLLTTIRDSLTGLNNAVSFGGGAVTVALLGQIKEGITRPGGMVARINARIQQAQEKFDFDRDITVPIHERQLTTQERILKILERIEAKPSGTPLQLAPIGGSLV